MMKWTTVDQYIEQIDGFYLAIKDAFIIRL